MSWPDRTAAARSTGALLLLSNGHGEDVVAAQLGLALRARGFQVAALPLVGHGAALRAARIPVVGPRQPMPSGGFVLGRPRALWQDLRAGLLQLTRAQWRYVREVAPTCDGLLAVGDIVPLAFAWASGRPYALVGCAKSDRYRGGRTGSYSPLERWLLRRPGCRGVWPRDAITSDNLQRAGVQAHWLGNPMMDALTRADAGASLPGHLDGATVLLLPGSRAEAPRNLTQLAAIARVHAQSEANRPATARVGRWLVAAAHAPETLLASEVDWQWQPDAQQEACGAWVHADGLQLHTVVEQFPAAAHAATIGLAMAGTATEQLVGLGKPVISLPGAGPQFTAAFADAQARLLAGALERAHSVPDAAQRLARLLQDPARRQAMGEAGRAAMGPPGASARIAAAIAEAWGGRPPDIDHPGPCGL